MTNTAKFDVLREHEGDRFYKTGDTREVSEADVKHLISAGVLAPHDPSKKPADKPREDLDVLYQARKSEVDKMIAEHVERAREDAERQITEARERAAREIEAINQEVAQMRENANKEAANLKSGSGAKSDQGSANKAEQQLKNKADPAPQNK